MVLQDRLDDILQARSLPDDLVAPGHLPAKRCVGFIGYPDFRQKAACIELGEDAGVDRIGLDLRMSDDAHLLGVCDHDLTSARSPQRPRPRCRSLRQRLHIFESFFAKASRRGRRMSMRPSRLSCRHPRPPPRRRRWISNQSFSWLSSVSVVQGGSSAGDTTSTVPRSRRIRKSQGRPCNERLSAHCYRPPAPPSCSRAPRVQDGFTISLSPLSETGGQQGAGLVALLQAQFVVAARDQSPRAADRSARGERARH